MSTHSAIGIQAEAGVSRITSIYCHYDGYLDHVGQTLLNHYTRSDEVYDLLRNGDLSSLGEDVGKPRGDVRAPSSKYCIYFSRDRGESWEDCEPLHTESVQEYLEAYDVSYYYLFVTSENRWYVKTHADKTFIPLADAIEYRNEDLTN
jgi:hypothetical protein